uniref:STT3 oligosaccharyltransferase complex catalytic subunit B n=2 Tax=Oreochromis TaxID=8139 RepID=A0A669EHC4_ORENI
MAEQHAASDGKHKASTNAGGSVHGNSRPGAAGGGGGKGGLSGGLTQPAGWQSLLSFSILFLACLAGFSSRLFAVIRFESIIHEFDPCGPRCPLDGSGRSWVEGTKKICAYHTSLSSY